MNAVFLSFSAKANVSIPVSPEAVTSDLLLRDREIQSEKKSEIQGEKKKCGPFNYGSVGASLVAQWLRIRLPVEGTQVRALFQEDPTCHGATKPECHNY